MKKVIFPILLLMVLFYISCANLQNNVNKTISVGEDSYVTYEVIYDKEGRYPSNSNNEYAVITGYTGNATIIQIPNVVQVHMMGLVSRDVPVSLIGARAFEGKGLKNVSIPNSVVSIGDRAFYNNQLTEVIIPNSVSSIGNNAFRNNKLTNVTYPANIRTIGENAFAGNSELTNIPMTNQQRQQQQQQQQRTEQQARITQQQAEKRAEQERLERLYNQAGQSFGNLAGTTWTGLIDNNVATMKFHFGGIYQLNVGGELFGNSIAGSYRVSGNTVIFNQDAPRRTIDDVIDFTVINEYESGTITGNTLHFFNMTFHRQ